MNQQNTQTESRSGSNGNQEPNGVAGKTHEAAERIKSGAAEQVQRVKDQAEQGRGQAADRIRRLSSAVRSAGDSLREEDQFVAQYADKASERIEQFATYVSSTDPRALLRDAQQLARQQPALFFGGAFLLGLAAGRFLKSSRSELDNDDFDMSDSDDLAGSSASSLSGSSSGYAGEYGGAGRPPPPPSARRRNTRSGLGGPSTGAAGSTSGGYSGSTSGGYSGSGASGGSGAGGGSGSLSGSGAGSTSGSSSGLSGSGSLSGGSTPGGSSSSGSSVGSGSTTGGTSGGVVPETSSGKGSGI